MTARNSLERQRQADGHSTVSTPAPVEQRRLRVGLTGGLAAGKSTVASWLRQAGYLVIDADRLVAELYAPGEAGSRVVGDLFGADYLLASGGVDASGLAARVFHDSDARKALEAAVHPLVGQRWRETVEHEDGVAVLEATLLVEAGFTAEFDLIVTVEADEEIRLARAMARGLSEGEARARLLAQGGAERRLAAADLTILNNGSLDDLRHQVEVLLEILSTPPTASQSGPEHGVGP